MLLETTSSAFGSDAAPPPSCHGVEEWIFDLDNTLYAASSSLFPQIDLRMRHFVAQLLDLDLESAFRLQKDYYHRYGTTLRGLILNHGVDPDRFLDYVHDIDHSVLTPDPRLNGLLAQLPGRRLIYTNGSEKHAVDVLRQLGMDGLFGEIFDIRAASFIPKPDPDSYARMIRRHAIRPQRAAMFEDLSRNLRPAHALGMLTVWVQEPGCSHAPLIAETDFSHVHYQTDNLADWLEQQVPPVARQIASATPAA